MHQADSKMTREQFGDLLQRTMKPVHDNLLPRGPKFDALVRPYCPVKNTVSYSYHNDWLKEWTGWIGTHRSLPEYTNDHLINGVISREMGLKEFCLVL